jgi:hypothetical protein
MSRQITAKTPDQVRVWIETCPHHKAARVRVNGDDRLKLTGPDGSLIIPSEVKAVCYIKTAGWLDGRMTRWDHEAERKELLGW